MAVPAEVCPNCGTIASKGARFCPNCGAGLPIGPGSALTGQSSTVTWPPGADRGPPGFPYGQTGLAPEIARARDRTASGLLLLVIGFALAWIPYVGGVGGLIAIIGAILFVLGRRGYGERHQRNASIGGALYFFGLVAGIVAAIVFVVVIVGQATTQGASLTSVGTELTNDIITLFVTVAVAGVIATVGQIIMVYALADRTTQILLWAGFVSGVVISAAVGLILVPQVAGAVQQATAGSTVNPGPLNQLEYTSNLLSLVRAVPSLLFAWAYYRCRTRALLPTVTPTR